jgi:hypothetical protein
MITRFSAILSRASGYASPPLFDISVVAASDQRSTAAAFNIGLITFDALIPASPQGDAGVSTFNIVNLNGDPGGGGSALASDFPVFTQLTLSNCQLTVVIGGAGIVIPLTPLGPGTFSSPATLQFPDTTHIDSATFTATLSTASVLLSDGTTVAANSAQVTATLAPTGPSLVPGTDLAIIGVTGLTPLSIAKTHIGNFTQGRIGATYTVTVSNPAAAGNTDPGSTVQFEVNQATVGTVSEPPYEMLFTVPGGHADLVLQIAVRTAAKTELLSPITRMTVVPDSGADIAGSIVQSAANSNVGLELSLAGSGLKAEFFHLAQP